MLIYLILIVVGFTVSWTAAAGIFFTCWAINMVAGRNVF